MKKITLLAAIVAASNEGALPPEELAKKSVAVANAIMKETDDGHAEDPIVIETRPG